MCMACLCEWGAGIPMTVLCAAGRVIPAEFGDITAMVMFDEWQ